MSDLQLSLDNTTLLEAIVWRDAHRVAWDEIVVWAHEDMRRRGYCSMQTYMETLRSPAVATRLGLQKRGRRALPDQPQPAERPDAADAARVPLPAVPAPPQQVRSIEARNLRGDPC